MTFYIVPSIFAVLIKAWLLWWQRSKSKENGALILLLGALLLMNIIEFSSFMLLDSPRLIAWLMHAYYCATAFAAAAILNLFLYLIGGTTAQLTKINWVLAAIIIALSAIPGAVIAGIENIGYTFIRIPGTLYIVWAVYIVSTLLFGVFLLLNGYRSRKDSLQRRRCLAVLLGLMPLICSAIGIVVLMLSGVKVNGTVILSCSVIFFLVALIYSEQRHALFRLLAHVPFTEEYALRSELANQVRKIESNAFGGADQSNFKDQIKKIESLYIDLAIIANDGNKTHAAAALGISSATLHRKATRKQRHVVDRSETYHRGKTRALRLAPAQDHPTFDEENNA